MSDEAMFSAMSAVIGRKDAEEVAERMQQMPTDLREYVRGYVAGVTDCQKKPEEKED